MRFAYIRSLANSMDKEQRRMLWWGGWFSGVLTVVAVGIIITFVHGVMASIH